MLKKALTAFVATVVLITTTGCSVVGIRTTPEPSYEVVKSDGQFEIRRYQPMVVVSTLVDGDFKSAGNRGFRPLFNYITGENQTNAEISMTAPVLTQDTQGQEIAMTAPVLTTEQNGQWEYQFVLPESFTIENAPQPTNPNVTLKETRPKTLAIIQYSGLWREKTKNQNQAKLLKWMSENGYEPIADPMIAGYDPPWTLPFFRRNEILIEIKAP